MEFDMKKGQFIALSPKCYLAFNEETLETKSGTKGVPKAAKIELENFLARLYHGTEYFVDLQSLRMVNNRMARTKTRKTALNDLFIKFAVQDDRISCLPLTEDGKFL